MIELVFFSTNKTKINHFRYLGRSVGVPVKSFKELNYYASYHEPRIDDRKELLRLSYISALSQWQKRQGKSDDDSTTFFFEDTSVVIHALSKDSEFPGVNVKFWMKETNFARLDLELRRSGNDRRATVRSDIVMHLPRRWKESLKIDEDYLWVHGAVEGQIVATEEPIDINLMFPWLDDKSFNRWFVPDGASVPISALPIETADQFDFRGRAFEKIVECLRKLNFIHEVTEQRALQLSLPRVKTVPTILVICGPTCAGKTTLATWLSDKFQMPHIEASDFMYRAFWERHGLGSAVKIGDFAQLALATQPDIVASQIVKHIQRKNFSNVVVTGFRSPLEVKIFKDGIGPDLECEIVYLDAEESTRLERAIVRNRDNITEEKFKKRDEQEVGMGLLNIRDELAAITVDNSQSLTSLFYFFSKRYRALLKMPMQGRWKLKFDSNLEPLIIMSMFDFVQAKTWLTTTEIASVVNRKFGQNKHKDNISRYFNQTYHPYYDARFRTSGSGLTRVIEYTLSTTGISEALLLSRFDELTLIRRNKHPKTAGIQLSLFD